MADPCPTSINNSASNGNRPIRHSDTKQYEYEHDHEEYAGRVLSAVGGRCAGEAECNYHRDGGDSGCVCGDYIGVLAVLQVFPVSVDPHCRTHLHKTLRERHAGVIDRGMLELGEET